MAILSHSMSANAKGGTELLRDQLIARISPEVLDKFTIINGRFPDDYDIDEDEKPKVYWVHDLPQDPNVASNLEDEKWDRFDRIVFVSHWQMEMARNMFNIPWYKCVVIQNAINPIEAHDKPTDGKIRLIYHTTPHRGLNILYPVFDALSKVHDNLELDVYSSFKIYGWEDRDKEFKDLFDALEDHPNINNHGSVPNEEVREALTRADIFAYPSTWPETSCMSLMEAMSAGLVCVHPNLAALPETAANWTWMYHYDEASNDHAQLLYQMLDSAIENLNTQPMQNRLQNQKNYADLMYNWDVRTVHWSNFLAGLADEHEIELPEVMTLKTENAA